MTSLGARARSACRHGLPLLFVAGLGAGAHPGADFHSYLEWSRVAQQSDLFALSGDTVSPFGVPFTHLAHGTGFVFAAVSGLLGGRVPLDSAAMVAGWFAAIVFWIAVCRLLQHVTRSDPSLVLFGLAFAFLGTHAGFYSVSHSSESLSLACLAVVAYLVMTPRDWRAIDALALGLASGLLLTIRVQLFAYAVVGLAVFADRLLARRRQRPTREIAMLTLLAGIPVLLGGLQVLAVNRWMTGSLLASAYVRSGGDFHSLDFRRPQFAAVLLHPWHGLLAYHPAYALGLLALVSELLGARSRRERVFYAAVLALLGAHLYVKASHFCWWAGTVTFGMRELATASVIVVPIFVRHLARRRDEGRSNAGWVLAAAVSALWSYLLLRRGETNLLTYRALLSSQLAELRWELTGAELVPILCAAGGAWLSRGIWRTLPGTSASAGGTGVFLSSLGLLALAGVVFPRLGLVSDLGPGVAVAIQAALACTPVLSLWALADTWRSASRGDRAFVWVTALGMAIVFAAAGAAFARLAVSTETTGAERLPGGRTFRYVGTMNYDKVLLSYREYRRVPGFGDEKKRLGDFLTTWAATHRVQREEGRSQGHR